MSLLTNRRSIGTANVTPFCPESQGGRDDRPRMSELAEIREAIQGTKVVLKGTLKMLRTTSQFLSDLERRLEELDAEPLEAERDEHLEPDGRADGDPRFAAYDHAA